MCRLNHSILGGVVSSLQNVRAATASSARQTPSEHEDRDWESLFRLLHRIREREAKNVGSLGCAVHCTANCVNRQFAHEHSEADRQPAS